MRRYRKFGVVTLALLLILTGAFNGQGGLTFADSNVGAQPIGSEPPAAEPAAVESASQPSSSPSENEQPPVPPAEPTKEVSAEIDVDDETFSSNKKLKITKQVTNNNGDQTPFEIKIYRWTDSSGGYWYEVKTMNLKDNNNEEFYTKKNRYYKIVETVPAGYQLEGMDGASWSSQNNYHYVYLSGNKNVTVNNKKDIELLTITVVKDVTNLGLDPTEFYVKLFEWNHNISQHTWNFVDDGTIIDDGTTELQFSGLVPGKYKIEEYNINSGYTYEGMTIVSVGGAVSDSTHNNNSKEFEIGSDVTITVENEKKQTRSITVFKDVINVDDDETLFDIDVNILGPTASSLYFRQISESGGSVEIGGLSNGDYRLAEVLPLPEGYEYVSIEGYSNNGEFTIGEEVDPIVFTIKNQLIKGKIEVYKDVLDLDDSTPFSLTLWDEWNQEVDTVQFFEGFDNRAVFNDLPYGTYHITEDDAAVEGYTFDSFDNGSGEVMIDVMGETETMTVYNTRDPRGSITIIKEVTNATDDPTLFTFNINMEVIATGGPLDSGETSEIAIEPLMFDDLVYGMYSISEMVPLGYMFEGFEIVSGNATLNGTALVTLGEGNEAVVIKAKNFKKQKIIIDKVVEGEDVDGQIFEIFIKDAAGQNIDGGFIQEGGLTFESEFLDPSYEGEYHIYEVPVQIYEHVGNTGDVDSINDDIVELPEEGDAHITVINQKRTGPGITIIKDVDNVTDDDTDFMINVYSNNLQPLSVGGETVLFGDLVFSGYVSETGSLFTGLLPMGSYCIEEVGTEGYEFISFDVAVVNASIQDQPPFLAEYNPFTCIQLFDQPIEITVTNRRLPGIVIHKNVNNVLDDPTEFTVNVYPWEFEEESPSATAWSSEPVFTGTISELNSLFVGGLEAGMRYKIEEIVPEGYELVEMEGTVEGGLFLGEGDSIVTIVNTKIHGSISITKDITNLDSTREFEVTVFDEEDEVVEVGTISEGGEPFVLSGLPFGTYTVEETGGTDANWIFDGFSGDTTNGEVTLSSENLELEVVVENRYQSTGGGGGGGGGGRRTPTPDPDPEIIPDDPTPLAPPTPEPEPELEILIPEEIIPEAVPSLPFTGGMVELEWLLMALGATTFGSGLVIRKKKEKK